MITDNRYIIVGLGKSGIGAANLLEEVNASYILYDSNDSIELNEVKEKLTNQNAQIILGNLEDEVINQFDIMIISPGVPIDAPFVNNVRNKNIKIWGEVELAYNIAKGKLAAITGTNGKTTTTALVGEIFENYYKESFTVGNIGIPYTSIAQKTTENSVTVAEISSFQLETIERFKPKVSAILNITPDHLNRHHTMECYIDTKFKITQNQIESDVCILNFDDKVLVEKSKKVKAKVIYFSSNEKVDNGIYFDGENIILNENNQDRILMKLKEMKLVGKHNVENVMAAILIAKNMDVPMEIIINTVKAFKAVPHRIEYVATKDDVIYYNDSKGTNTDASTKAIEAMTRPTILIAGGYDKGVTYDEWIDSFNGKIKALVLIGKTKDKIRKTALSKGYTNIYMVDTLKDAVKKSKELSSKGDVVLLSPACASWDMFKSYEQRGDMFKDYVKEL